MINRLRLRPNDDERGMPMTTKLPVQRQRRYAFFHLCSSGSSSVNAQPFFTLGTPCYAERAPQPATAAKYRQQPGSLLCSFYGPDVLTDLRSPLLCCDDVHPAAGFVCAGSACAMGGGCCLGLHPALTSKLTHHRRQECCRHPVAAIIACCAGERFGDARGGPIVRCADFVYRSLTPVSED